MSLRQVLAVQHHRPWPLPSGAWILTQWWRNLLFAHWKVDPAVLASLLPDALEPETFDGAAWIGVIPFQMSGVRFRGLPPIPGISNFCELNVRTYVRPKGLPGEPGGVYFWSLDASSRLAVWGARTFFHLAYENAEMNCSASAGSIHYTSRRRLAEFDARYRPTADAIRDPLHHWLTERYCLYTTNRNGSLFRGDIHHRPWPLVNAEVDIQLNTMASPLGLSLKSVPDACAFSREIEVAIWPLRKLR
jgi:uncharacterized protein YqjF (DUF2071 family)